MALLIPIGQPETEGERRVIRKLRDELSDEWTVFHNLELTNRRGFPFDYDLIAVGDNLVYVLEVKDYAGKVVGSAHQWRMPNGAVFPSPIPTLNRKAKILSGRIKKSNPALRDVYVESAVVLAEPSTTATLRDAQGYKVVPIDDIVAHLSSHRHLPVAPRPLGTRSEMIIDLIRSDFLPQRRTREIGVYEIVEPIGHFDDYDEYLARHRYLKTEPLARLKVYHYDVYQDPAERERQLELIFRDLNALKKLAGHPNIARASDVFPWEADRFVVPTEWIDGDTLRALIEDDAWSPTWEEKLEVIDRVATGLRHAHEHGVIHRDLRPENITVGADGVVKITNFDFARVLGGQLQTVALQIGRRLSERYTAPEVLDDPSSATAASDVYALGIILFELLAGATPYASMLDLARHRDFTWRPTVADPTLDPRIDDLVVAMCRFVPNDRLNDMSIVRERIAALPRPAH